MKASLEDILDNKEQRVIRQKEFLSSFAPIMCISVNMPGSVKLNRQSIYIYDEILCELKARLDKKNILLKALFEKADITGKEGIFYVPLNSHELKKLTCHIENEHFLGRFVDIDVIDYSGKILTRKDFGYESRRCFLCEKNAFLCARSKTHDINELLSYIKKQVSLHKKVKKFSKIAKKSMFKEVNLTPKPGLVDRRDNGSHKDMNIGTFYKSIEAIGSFLEKFVWCGYFNEPKIVFQKLRTVGLDCENAMFKSTDGVNTHKGLIFSFAVILGSIGFLLRQEKNINQKNLQDVIKKICKDLIKNDFKNLKNPKSAGERYFIKTNNGGIRAEARSGYESIFLHILPFFKKYKKIYKTKKALKLTLLKIICVIDDTSIYNRGGEKGLKYAKKLSKKILNKTPKNLNKTLKNLNKKFRKKNLSPGGSADILALTYFLDKILSK